jgi:RNA polymerase sigma factor FliA
MSEWSRYFSPYPSSGPNFPIREPIVPDRIPGDGMDDLWARFKSSGDPAAREALILHFAPLVKFVAGRVAAGLPRNVDQADLVSNGVFGLIDAINKFDPTLGFMFETYATRRINGAILDGLRALDWVPRSVRSKVREIERALRELEHRLHRTASVEELAEYMGIDLDSVLSTLAEMSKFGIVSLDELLGPESGTPLVDILPDSTGLGPEAAFQAGETRHILTDAIGHLSEREKLVVTLYYYESLTLAEIGEVLGVTESRISQIHSKAVLSLRNRLAEPPFA